VNIKSIPSQSTRTIGFKRTSGDTSVMHSIEDNKLPMVQHCKGRDFDGFAPETPMPTPDPRTPRNDFRAETVRMRKYATLFTLVPDSIFNVS